MIDATMQPITIQQVLDTIREDAFREGAQQMREAIADQLATHAGHNFAQEVRGHWPIEWGSDPGPFIHTEDNLQASSTFEIPAPDRPGTLGGF